MFFFYFYSIHHYMIRPLRAILKWNIHLSFPRGYQCYNGSLVFANIVSVYVCSANTILLHFYIFVIMLKL
jgi:hypothetical protein